MTENSELKPIDILTYLYLRSYDNPQHECFPSFEKLSQLSGAAIGTLRKCVKNLETAGYITVKKKGRSNYYYFDETYFDRDGWEKFYREFLENKNLTYKEKAYIVSTQQYMYKDLQNIGKISYSDSELAQKLNVSESTIYRNNKDLERKQYLDILKGKNRDFETGCKEDIKVFRMDKIGQAALWLIEDHEERIEKLEETVESQKKLIQMLLDERKQPSKEYIM